MSGKVTIISRELIKPSSPTPSILQTYNLSELDQLFNHNYIPLLFLYPNNLEHVLDKSNVLKQSLSCSLTKYYPFAGRLPTPVKPSYIDCNDEGVVFVEAKINSPLSEFHHITNEHDLMDQLFADNLVGCNSPQSTNVVGVQLNHFSCGGVALAVSMSHAIGDACTLGWFINQWAIVAHYGPTNHPEMQPLNPYFINSSRFTSLAPASGVKGPRYANWAIRKFLFPNSKLSDLKNKVIGLVAAGSDQRISNPTRVEVLTSLLYKTAVEAATKKSGCFQPSCLIILADIRKKFVEKLPQTSVGNILSAMMVPTRDPSETSISCLVSKIQKDKLQLGVQSVQHAAQNIKSVFSKLGNAAKHIYACSSFCNFPFNKVDFGWGKPAGMESPALKWARGTGFLLMDTADGHGIEAMVILEKEDMEIFENDTEMLSFCQIKET